MVASPALRELLLQLADDELLLGHRDAEWLGLAPHIELDVAFSAIAQDEVGHAALYYQLLADLSPGQDDLDRLAFHRRPAERRNAVLLERPNGPGHCLKEPRFDWAYTIVRHYLYDLFDLVRLEALADSGHAPLARAVVKIRREERYHLLHHETWFKRLAHYGGESRRKLEAGLQAVWPEVGGLFALGPAGPAMVGEGLFPGGDRLLERWRERLLPVFNEAGLLWPGEPVPAGLDGRGGQHTPDLGTLLDTISAARRQDPAAKG